MPTKKVSRKPKSTKTSAGQALADRISRAQAAGRYLVFTVRVEDGRVWCDWNTHNFPVADLPTAQKLVELEFKNIKGNK